MLDNNPLTSLLKPPLEQDTWRWGTVTALTPLAVQVDGDSKPLLTDPDVLCPLQVGDRVRIHISARKACIIGVKTPTGQVIPENSLRIQGHWYQASGVQPCPSYRWGYSGSDWVATTLFMPLPYKPPAGYGFAYSILKTSGFTLAQTGQPTGNNTEVRLLNYKHNAPAIGSLQWQLVKQS